MPTKIHRSISIDKDLITWITKQIEHKRFKDVSHAIEYAIYQLKLQEEKNPQKEK
jgi:Arc/MetJ-type ribon-helix-helix transcriptional regulator